MARAKRTGDYDTPLCGKGLRRAGSAREVEIDPAYCHRRAGTVRREHHGAAGNAIPIRTRFRHGFEPVRIDIPRAADAAGRLDTADTRLVSKPLIDLSPERANKRGRGAAPFIFARIHP